jgi:hypothetical protein
MYEERGSVHVLVCKSPNETNENVGDLHPHVNYTFLLENNGSLYDGKIVELCVVSRCQRVHD